MEGKVISVVVAVYNIEDYIGQCLESIIGQSYQEIEIICIDDGSTDGSGRICDRYAALDSRIKVIHQENQGAAMARNAGLDCARGNYVSIIDGDDWIEPDMFKYLVDAMENEGVDIASCAFYYEYFSEQIQRKNKKRITKLPILGKKFLYYVYNRDPYKGVGAFHWSRLYRRKMIEDYSIRYDDTFILGEDVIFLTNCYLTANKTTYIDVCLYHYRIHDKSLSHDKQVRVSGLWAIKAYDEVIKLLSKYKTDKKTIDYARRLKIYHAGEILRLAIAEKDNWKIEEIRELIKKEFMVYVRLNWRYPKRVKDLYMLLK